MPAATLSTALRRASRFSVACVAIAGTGRLQKGSNEYLVLYQLLWRGVSYLRLHVAQAVSHRLHPFVAASVYRGGNDVSSSEVPPPTKGTSSRGSSPNRDICRT